MVAFKFFTHSSCFTSCKTAVGHNLLHIVITQRKDTYETNIFIWMWLGMPSYNQNCGDFK